jgi:hypothetical protein
LRLEQSELTEAASTIGSALLGLHNPSGIWRVRAGASLVVAVAAWLQ